MQTVKLSREYTNSIAAECYRLANVAMTIDQPFLAADIAGLGSSLAIGEITGRPGQTERIHPKSGVDLSLKPAGKRIRLK